MSIFSRVGRLFPRNDAIDSVETKLRCKGSPAVVWDAMMFYEEVPQRPGALLRFFIPLPIATHGEKTRVDAKIDCEYQGGSLEKRITAVDAPRSVSFDVTKQALGIEDAIAMTGGSYVMRADGDETEVVLTTRYHGHMRPRWMFRPIEEYLAHRVHQHILDGMQLALASAADPAPAGATART